ncbi:MAG: glycerol-3-phosphate 1-O-acyltransferase PlsY [Proteocatella sp.]
MYNLKMIIPLIIMSYFIGNISPSVIISRRYNNSDIREHGSGNAGATNVMRVMGKKAGIIVFLMDMLKGILPTALGMYFGNIEIGFFCGVSTVLGHIFPVLLGFKGGKGVATSLGVGLVLAPLYALTGFLVFGLIVMKTKYVSLGSIMGTLTFPILQIATVRNPVVIVMSFVLGMLIVYSHRANIKRLLSGTENKIGVSKK